ncbi:hypothetical protein Xcel_3422 (plasmid) [Xylanimonas cellulosilytica DSM 15894]|uniref:Uncharacterized protein n=1 Tax=Xylanimonas cellulosilytica (strain DSM 15894 / JCM 12276 / CECT 5975 / KCTC 9989 / LMG 20990 / NBRC 107835 / XIL07) TaxID=446471 RepID=D1C0V5_XYLCX|nr:hypothetical protein [Xylanimonas cellulosilytica]ACZ32421.1 hypothetical protein Xcel_3422 [Xylanimonas cellulosilytica DSM 15894]
MNQIIATAYLFGLNVADATRKKLTTRPERGSVSIEQVVITAALLLAAIALVAVIGNAIANRSAAIN